MQLAALPLKTHPSSVEASLTISEHNQKVYSRLKLSLGLNLRRQIFLAICDDLALRDYLASQLPVDSTCSSLITLTLNPRDPNPLAQIDQWIKAHSIVRNQDRITSFPGFQVLGAECLTHQPASVQQQFLETLQQVECYLSSLNCTLLLWLPRPWFRAIQQSAPAFWDWHTGLFEFEGDPTPIPKRTGVTSKGVSDRIATTEHHQTQPEQENRNIASEENVWEILTHDLAEMAEVSSHSVANVGSDLADLRGLSSNGKTTASASNSNLISLELLQPDAQVDHAIEPSQSTLMPPSPPDSPEPATPAARPTKVPDPGISAHLSFSNPTLASLTLADLVLAIADQAVDEESERNYVPLIQALQQIEQLHEEQAAPATLAAAYRNLGTLYRDRIEQGDTSEQTLMVAIRAYEQTLAWLDAASPQRSDVLNDVGNLYWLLCRNTGDANQNFAYLEQAIAVYEQALALTDSQNQPFSYAMIQNNLGSAYSDLAHYQDAVKNLQRSVHAYEESLRYRRLEDDPARCAATQNNLGTACWNLAQHQQPLIWLRKAIIAYREALRYYSPQREPLYYAMIQNNLGTAFWNFAQYEQTMSSRAATKVGISQKGLLLQAVNAYRAALIYRTLETAPAAYAASQNNLGTAYWNLASLAKVEPEERQKYLQQAIAAYKAALTAVDYLSVKQSGTSFSIAFDPLATSNNLGLAYYAIVTDPHYLMDDSQRQSHLESALQYQLHALQGWADQPDLYQAVFGYVIQTIRAFYAHLGLKGQSLALSKLPPHLLPDVMKRL